MARQNSNNVGSLVFQHIATFRRAVGADIGAGNQRRRLNLVGARVMMHECSQPV